MISKIKLFISKYNWKEMKNSSGQNGWKTFGKNNPTIALIVLYFKNIYPAHISKHNLNHLVGNFDAQSVEINLQETLTFICMQKNQLHI